LVLLLFYDISTTRRGKCNHWKSLFSEIRRLIFFSSHLCGGLVIAGVLASKIANVGGLMVPGGVLAYSITFPITDIICEDWGKKETKLCGL